MQPSGRALTRAVSRSGVGLHSGQPVRVCLRPVPPSERYRGRYFVRTDLPGAPEIPATCESVGETVLSTELAAQGASVRTVEHLLAALWAAGLDAVRIETDGPELPLLDGSARDWVAAIAEGAIAEIPPDPADPNPEDREPAAPLAEPLWIREGDAFVAALPADRLRFTYGIDFATAAIGNQWHSWAPPEEAPGDRPASDGSSPPAAIAPPAELSAGSFAAEIAPARTFGLAGQVEALRARGLIRGGSLENALVCDEARWLNPPLRFPNEPARHKILDLVGDLSLVGRPPVAHYLAYKASHRLHVRLARAIATRRSRTAVPSLR